MSAPERVDLAAIERLGEYVSDCRWSAAFGVVRGLDDAAFPAVATAVRDADAEWIAYFDPPTVRHIVDELAAAREFRNRVFTALEPGRWRGFDGPDGVSTHEVIADVAAALRGYQHTETRSEP